MGSGHPILSRPIPSHRLWSSLSHGTAIVPISGMFLPRTGDWRHSSRRAGCGPCPARGGPWQHPQAALSRPRPSCQVSWLPMDLIVMAQAQPRVAALLPTTGTVGQHLSLPQTAFMVQKQGVFPCQVFFGIFMTLVPRAWQNHPHPTDTASAFLPQEIFL